MSNDDTGPAFPISSELVRQHKREGFQGCTTWDMGMTRLEYFAGCFIAGGHTADSQQALRLADDFIRQADLFL